jgi:hypothetical protein
MITLQKITKEESQIVMSFLYEFLKEHRIPAKQRLDLYKIVCVPLSKNDNVELTKEMGIELRPFVHPSMLGYLLKCEFERSTLDVDYLTFALKVFRACNRDKTTTGD